MHFGILKTKNKNKTKNKGVEAAVQFSEFGHEIPVHCGNPEDDMHTIDTCIPVVHALFFFTNGHSLSGISSFFDTIAETKSV